MECGLDLGEQHCYHATHPGVWVTCRDCSHGPYSKVQSGVEPILVEGNLGWIVEPDAGESGIEGNGMSDGGHDKQRKGKKN
jgi:hypothetical protein